MKLNEVLQQAKENNEKCILALVEKFSPLINKYGSKLNDDGKSEITFFLLKLIKKMPDFQSDDKIVSYVHMSIKHFFFHLAKNTTLEYPTDNEYIPELAIEDDGFGNIEIFNLVESLPDLQRRVILGVFYFGYSEAYIAQKFAVSRQAIHNAKKRGLDKLRHYLSR